MPSLARPVCAIGAAVLLLVAVAGDGAFAQTVLWQRTLFGVATETGPFPLAAQPFAGDATGNAYLLGQTRLIKYAGTDGAVRWDVPLAGSGTPGGIVVDQAGNAIVARVVDFAGNVRLESYAGADGSLRWQAAMPTCAAASGGVALHPGNGIVIGAVSSCGESARILVVAAATGATVFGTQRTGSAARPRRPAGLAIAADGSVAYAGTDADQVGLPGDNTSLLDVVRFDASGAVLWSWTGPGEARAVAVDPAGAVIVAGTVTTGTATDHVVVKLPAAAGRPSWRRTLDGIWAGYDEPVALAVDGSGDVLLAGIDYVAGAYVNQGDAVTRKLRGSDGEVLWLYRVTGAVPPDSAKTWPLRAEVAANGDVLATYSVENGSGAGRDVVTHRHAAATGLPLWTRLHASAGAGYGADDYPRGQALDAQGEPAILVEEDEPDGKRVRILKYAGGDGQTRWSATVPPSPVPQRAKMARAGLAGTDATGNVIVAGEASNGLYDTLFAAKLASGDGALLWRKQFTDAGYAACSLHVLAGGDIVVVGSGSGACAVLGLRGSDGTVAWRQDLPSFRGSEPCACRGELDSAGAVFVAASTGQGVVLHKLGALDGAKAWSTAVATPAAFGQSPILAVDVNRDAWFAGHDFRAYKVRGSDGVVLATGAPPGFAGWDVTLLNAGRTDAQGNLLLGGRVILAGVGNFVAVKLAAADATHLWTSPLGHGYSQVNALAVAGDAVFATGFSYETPNFFDVRTVRYDPATGAPQWSRAFHLTQSGDYDAAYGVTVDPAGHALVAGTGPVVLRYGQVTGTLLAKFKPWASGTAFSLAAGAGATFVAGEDNGGVPAGIAVARFAMIDPARSVVTAGARPNPSHTAIDTMLEARVEPQEAGGWVTFYGPGGPVCSTGALANGYGWCTARLPAGQWTIVARHSGNADVAGGSSSWLQQVTVPPGQACSGFYDVSVGSPFCANVEWLANRSITLGCAAGWYCPDATASRLSMAAFMNRAGTALAPEVVPSQASPGALDLDLAPVVCTTADRLIEDFPRGAAVDGVFSATATAAVGIGVTPVASVDGGVSWVPLVANGIRVSIPASHWTNVRAFAIVGLEVGQTVRFGLRVDRGGLTGTADVGDSRCVLRVVIGSRDGATSPYVTLP